MVFDYIFPGWIAKAFRKPTLKVQLEASMVGLIVVMIGSILTCLFVIFGTQTNLFLKVVSGISEVGILLFMLPNLVTTYMQYYQYKMTMDLYPADIKLAMKIKEAEDIEEELHHLIVINRMNPRIKSKEVKHGLVH